MADSGTLRYGRGEDNNKRSGRTQDEAFKSIGVWPDLSFVAGAGFGEQTWALLLGPGELGAPTKVGVFDESVVLDQVGYLFDCLAVLKARCVTADQRIWSFPKNDLSVQMQSSAEALGLGGLGLTVYGLRHGGASHDLLVKARPALEVKGRGRWRTDAMLKRYGKEARVLAELHKAPLAVLEFGRSVASRLREIFVEREALPPLPLLRQLP